jgi:hypothetical protein
VNLQPRREEITVQREFLFSTSGLIHKVGNVTLDGAAFEGLVLAGTVVVQGANGLSTPYDGATYTPAAGRVYITANDIEVGDNNVQIGAIEEGFVREDRLTGYHADLAVDSEYRYKIR